MRGRWTSLRDASEVGDPYLCHFVLPGVVNIEDSEKAAGEAA